jgi:hypothetical protein
MNLTTCTHQIEVQRLLALGHFPRAATAELRAHVAACRQCADLVLVTQAFQASRAGAAAQASLPAPGVLWWRAQLRKRNAALERVNRPIVGAQIFAFVITLAATAGLLISQARHGVQWLSWFGESQGGSRYLDALLPSTLPSSGWSLAALVGILATVALVSAVAIYLASEKQ